MREFFQKSAKNQLIPALINIILGVLIIIFRRKTMDTLVLITGWILIVGAVAMICSCLFGKGKDGDSDKKSLKYTIALLCAVVGLFFIFSPKTVTDIFPILMGVGLILNGLGSISSSAAMEGGRSFLAFILGILVMILGGLIIFHPGDVINIQMILIGAALILNGFACLDLFRVNRPNDPDVNQ